MTVCHVEARVVFTWMHICFSSWFVYVVLFVPGLVSYCWQSFPCEQGCYMQYRYLTTGVCWLVHLVYKADEWMGDLKMQFWVEDCTQSPCLHAPATTIQVELNCVKVVSWAPTSASLPSAFCLFCSVHPIFLLIAKYFHGEHNDAWKYSFCTYGTSWPMGW